MHLVYRKGSNYLVFSVKTLQLYGVHDGRWVKWYEPNKWQPLKARHLRHVWTKQPLSAYRIDVDTKSWKTIWRDKPISVPEEHWPAVYAQEMLNRLEQ